MRWFYAPAAPSANSSWVLWRKHASNSPSLNPEWTNSKRNTHKPAGGRWPRTGFSDSSSARRRLRLQQPVSESDLQRTPRPGGAQDVSRWDPGPCGTDACVEERSDLHRRSAGTASFPLRERASGCERGYRGQVLVSVKGAEAVRRSELSRWTAPQCFWTENTEGP